MADSKQTGDELLGVSPQEPIHGHANADGSVDIKSWPFGKPFIEQYYDVIDLYNKAIAKAMATQKWVLVTDPVEDVEKKKEQSQSMATYSWGAKIPKKKTDCKCENCVGPPRIPISDQPMLPLWQSIVESWEPYQSCAYCYGTGYIGLSPLQAWKHQRCNICVSSAKCKTCPICQEQTLALDSTAPKTDWGFPTKKTCTNGCGFSWPNIDFKSVSPENINPSIFRTQKVRGLTALGRVTIPWGQPEFAVIREEKDLNSVGPRLFYRPCPTVPRHGFVPSRVCTSKDEIRALWKETLAQDKDAEFLVMKYMEAASSAIYIPESGAIAIGPSHDGATSGKNSIILPLVPSHHNTSMFYLEQLRSLATIPAESHTYIELVAKKKFHKDFSPVFAVQARSGPPLATSSPDFVPKEVTVTEVITPPDDDDLLAWEKLVGSKKGQTGLVAWQPGSTLASHAAVHCVAAGIPFITSMEKAPEIGSKLVPKTTLPQFSQLEADRGWWLAWETKQPRLGEGLKAALGILHNAATLRTSPHWSRLYGYAAGMIFRGGALACCGEARHDSKSTCVTESNRSTVWKVYGAQPIGWVAQKTARLIPMFLSSRFSGGKGVGGPNWAQCALEVSRLYKSWSLGKQDEVLSAMNRVVNVCHNNGKLLSKFVSSNDFNHAAESPGPWFSKYFYYIWKILQKKPLKELKPVPKLARRGCFLTAEPVAGYGGSTGNPRICLTYPIGWIMGGKVTIRTHEFTWGDSANELPYKVFQAYVKEF